MPQAAWNLPLENITCNNVLQLGVHPFPENTERMSLERTFLWEGGPLLGALLGGKHGIHLLKEVLPQLLKLSWRGSL